MSKDTITLIVSIAAVLVSIATFSVAYSQMKIASAKIRLDLYNKRFAVYVSALDYYHSTWYESQDKIKERGNQFVKFYRESQFLFESGDGVYDTLKKIMQNGADIQYYEKDKYEREKDPTKGFPDSERDEKMMSVRFDFEENLKTLEQKIEKYIKFKTISGWKFF